MSEWLIRQMVSRDLDGIMGIEKALFADPWSRKAFESEFLRPGGIALTAEVNLEPVGYAIGWSVADEIHIANLAVHPDWQNRGIGRSLLETLLASSPEATWAGLEVRRSNMAAIALYSKMGFRETGVRKKYYAEEGEDALLMEKLLSNTKRGKHGVV